MSSGCNIVILHSEQKCRWFGNDQTILHSDGVWEIVEMGIKVPDQDLNTGG